MAESTSVALAAAPIPSSADIARAEKLVRERFVHEGEDPTADDTALNDTVLHDTGPDNTGGHGPSAAEDARA